MKEAEAESDQYLKTRGQDSLEQQEATKQRVDQIIQKYGDQLAPSVKHRYDSAVRMYQLRYLDGKINSHANQQGQQVAQETYKSTVEQAVEHAARNANDPAQVQSAVQDAEYGYMQDLKFKGLDRVPERVAEAKSNAAQAVYRAAAESKFAHNAPDGYQYVKDHEKDLGAAAAPLLDKFRARATEIAAEQKSDVLRRIYQEPDPMVRQGIADANRAVLGDVAVPGVTNKSNVVPLRPGAPEQKPGETEADALVRQAKEKLPGSAAQPWKLPPLSSPSQRKAGQSLDDWYKENGGKVSGATQANQFAKTETTGNAASGAIEAALQHGVDAHTDRNLFSSGAAKRKGIDGGVGQNLTNINDSQGHTIEVNAAAAPHFAGFLKELSGMGYKIGDIGGYSNRRIMGTNTYSEHAFGNAIDINPGQNPQGGGTNLPPNVGQIAAKYGLIWGGDWYGHSRDPMHFEWSGKGQQVAGQ